MELSTPWTEITRLQYRRADLRYASDLTDPEWEMIVPFMPKRRHFDRRRSTSLRAVVEALFYIASTRCQWRQLPKDFPPYSTVQGYFHAWVREGRWEMINHALVMASREKAGRQASPTAGIVDSQSVKTTESGGASGLDAGKKIRGRKRHIVTDTAGHLVGLLIHIASIQDHDGVVKLLASIRSLYPWLRHVFADGGYAGQKLRHALHAFGQWTMQIIRRTDPVQGFEILPRRWVAERTFAWLGRCRRLAKDFETNITSSTAWTLIAHVRRLTRTLARV